MRLCGLIYKKLKHRTTTILRYLLDMTNNVAIQVIKKYMHNNHVAYKHNLHNVNKTCGVFQSYN